MKKTHFLFLLVLMLVAACNLLQLAALPKGRPKVYHAGRTW